ncbi:hypothetical protein SJ271_03060 [Citrobacter freundii]|nr:hypothetical protein [Citrobacter freundii]EGT0626699.1 hypothetical protein [Citrobacter freundii]ELI7002790.1 hypothetical protein [Citrobacter freundii]MBJ9274723.1 hypothetical protein [Citrobacter freundii]MDX7141489.1 hypothetical protein [Citrobacter freundii]HCR3441982.1 hypothetical protein [Citrobacter freundii]
MTLEQRVEALEKETKKEAAKELTAKMHLTDDGITITREGVNLVRLLVF